jgi:hypothetical protein
MVFLVLPIPQAMAHSCPDITPSSCPMPLNTVIEVEANQVLQVGHEKITSIR